jgi:hypothetical protein
MGAAGRSRSPAPPLHPIAKNAHCRGTRLVPALAQEGGGPGGDQTIFSKEFAAMDSKMSSQRVRRADLRSSRDRTQSRPSAQADDDRHSGPGACSTSRRRRSRARPSRRRTSHRVQRSEVSDSEGVYRITGLPVGSYALSIELSGFQPQTRTVQVNVSETVRRTSTCGSPRSRRT